MSACMNIQCAYDNIYIYIRIYFNLCTFTQVCMCNILGDTHIYIYTCSWGNLKTGQGGKSGKTNTVLYINYILIKNIHKAKK